MAGAPDRDEVDGDAWTVVQDVIGPLDGGVDGDALYATGARFGAPVPTGSGVRARLLVPAGGTASFGAYFNAFPAAVWRSATAATAVRLRLRLSGPAAVTLLRSDARGATALREEHAVGDDGLLAVTTPLGGATGGFVWFEIAAAEEVEVLEGSWAVDAVPLRGGRAVLGMPTMDRGPFVAANLRRLASAPELLRRVRRIVVVDQGGSPVADDPAVAAAADDLGDVVRLLRQANLGGSGGYSRILQEALAEQGADVAVFLDDDIQIEPASLLRSIAFGRLTGRPTIVGGQMLDLGEPGTVQAAAERVVRSTFWWAAADERTSTHDHVATPLPSAPWVHERRDADYNGWWMCQFPLETVRRIGLVLPLFLKWDDAEYSLRAAGIGVPTVSLPGAAVWHVAFRTKDDSIEWQAFFHARNRVVVAMLHGGRAAAVAGYSLALDVKQLLAKQYPAARLRHAGIRAALDGPDALERRDDLARARAIAAAEPALPRLPREACDGVRAVRPRLRAPSGADLGTWAARTALQQLLRGASGPIVRVPRADWWVLARFGRVLAPTADGEALLRFDTDRRALAAGLLESFALHLRLVLQWDRTAAAYRRAAVDLASPEAWRRRFTA
ncbi:glycosyltransferase [Amnibacterium kyonggiense]|uniref:Galactofuranosylgalactofuranosylrhamnosyl-N-acetylglucosaminyl-diphospho-decaprenol beta-1,5/1,6-galactofuranosyltransferase n=1 Tax=Amnibacterium kyonggiense TaxID=595671 RepID=A0A4R7FLX1_9MICO|nr:glycosyltransferase [Amnibacterium kyonggiense]TDS77393.1 galactofuranosylgalactofuranosylrhamnosyl-N-acetylglucosaminyl-diphospho-decaprenol beta-1,5/1,6-galactofuranosyltransferase [Amnibacterium kyonggiense]